MDREQKAAVVDEIAGEIQRAGAVFAVDYRGLSVAQAAELRAKLRDADTKFRIVKNSLSERAADKAGAQELKSLLEGPTALALVRGDAALAAKALNDTARALHILEFKGGLMDGAALSADDVRAIARLPARDVLHAQLAGTIAAPLGGLVRGLNALIAGIAIQLQAIADQGLVSGEAPAPKPPAEKEPAPAAQPEAEAAPEPEPEPQAPAEPEPTPPAAPAAEAEAAAEQSDQTEAQDAPDAESSDA
jgi:large subunit ribosomal protein L10